MDTQQKENILSILNEVKDPEIPVLSVNDMGIIRDIRLADDLLEIDITPTYTGCPAMDVIEKNIIDALRNGGYHQVKVNTVLAPPWTTDWITAEGMRNLEAFGIAPPIKGSADKRALFQEAPKPRCPYCKSPETNMLSAFGSTACKAQYKCSQCLEAFDYFKCI